MGDNNMTTEARIDALLATPALERAVDAYFDPRGPFAASTFDELAPNLADAITVTDVVAVSLLDVRVKPRALRQILEEDAALLSQLLDPDILPTDVPLWRATEAQLSHAAKLWNHLRSYPGIDWVIAGKLMARKRPCLVPVVDSVIVRLLQPPSGEVWSSIGVALRDDVRRAAVEGLRPPGVEVSTLRLLDVALWMLGSRSRNVKRVWEEIERGEPNGRGG